MEVLYADMRFERLARGTGTLPGLPGAVAFEFRGFIRWLSSATHEQDLLAMIFLEATQFDSPRARTWRFRLIHGFSVTCLIEEGVATVVSLQQE